MKKLSSEKRIYLVATLAFLCAAVLWCIFSIEDSIVKEVDIADYELLPEGQEGYVYGFTELDGGYHSDKIYMHTYIVIRGYAAKIGEDELSASFNVIVRDKNTGKAFMLPTEMEESAQTIDAADGLSHKYAGFVAKVRNDRYIDLSKSDYEIYGLYMVNGQEKLIKMADTMR